MIEYEKLVEDLRDGLVSLDGPCTCRTDELNCPYCNASQRIDTTMHQAADAIEMLDRSCEMWSDVFIRQSKEIAHMKEALINIMKTLADSMCEVQSNRVGIGEAYQIAHETLGEDEVDTGTTDGFIRSLEAKIERLEERCEAYKGQVKNAEIMIEKLKKENREMALEFLANEGQLMDHIYEYHRALQELYDYANIYVSGVADIAAKDLQVMRQAKERLDKAV